MTNPIAIAKKSGKKFEVIDQTEISVVLKDVVSGEEKEIKVSTFTKGYTVTQPEETQEVPTEQFKVFYSNDYEQAKTFAAEHNWNITFVMECYGFNGDCYIVYRSFEDIPEGWMREGTMIAADLERQNIENGAKLNTEGQSEQTPQKEQPKADEPEAFKPYVAELINALNDTKATEAIIAKLASEVPTKLTTPTNMTDAVRFRDNNRQCFKENENRFKIAVENKDEEKYVLSYTQKMVEYYAKYLAAKAYVDDLKAKKTATEPQA